MTNNPKSNDEIKDKIHFSIQWAADMGNVTIAVAVGLFGILSIFTLLQTSDKGTHFGQLWWYKSDFWKLPVFALLTAAYWGVSVLGFTCLVYRRQFDALTDYYLKKQYPDYFAEFREVAKKNVVTNWLLNRPTKEISKRVWPDFVVFVVIATLLWVFIGLF